MVVKLYTASEIQALLDRFSKVNLDSQDQRMVMDYMATTQTIAKAVDDFLDKHGKPKKTTFLGLFNFGEEDEE